MHRQADLWNEGGRGLAQRGVLARLSRRPDAMPGVPAPPPVTVWQALRLAPRASLAASLAAIWGSFTRHQAAFWGALAISLLAAMVASMLQQPPAEAQIRLATDAPDGSGEAGQQALASARQALEGPALRMAALDALGWAAVFPDLAARGDAMVQDSAARYEALRRLAACLSIAPAEGPALLVRMRLSDAEGAARYDQALVAALLARPLPQAAARPPAVTGPTGQRELLAGDLAASERRAAVLSDRLNDTAHDMVAALRSNAAPAARDVLDQGRALMAELQLKRLELASKYQDDFPAVTALDAEIEKLRGFLAGEQKRGLSSRGASNPVLETLGAERRRLEAELDAETVRRASLRDRLATLDRQIAAAPAQPPAARLVAGPVAFLSVPDPRQLSVPAILLVGLGGALLLQWALLRARTTIATVAEAELILGVPVLRCLDADGRPIAPPKVRRRCGTLQNG